MLRRIYCLSAETICGALKLNASGTEAVQARHAEGRIEAVNKSAHNEHFLTHNRVDVLFFLIWNSDHV